MIPVPLLLALAAAARAADYPLPPPPVPSTTTTRLDFRADRLDYEQESAVIHLQGHVVVRESTWTLKGQDVYLDTKKQAGQSRGDLLVEDGQSALYGDFGEFDFANHTGELHHASAGHGDWRVHARSARLDEHRKLDYLGADFTSCNAVPPHYHFHATRITVVPRRYLFARNTLFFIGPVPLFYTPFFYHSLKPAGFIRFKVQPGYDRRNGTTLRGTAIVPITPYAYGKLYLDYYHRQGIGTGVELNHRDRDNRGVLSFYRIKETSTGTERWQVLGNEYRTLSFSPATSVQARGELQSDASFNNDYARSRPWPVQPQLIDNAAVTYRFKQSSVRAAYSLTEQALFSPTKYMKQTEDVPRIDYQTSPLRVWRLPWLNTYTAFADNNYTYGRPYLQRSAGANWEITRGLTLWPGRLSWAPKLGYGQTFYDRLDQPGDFGTRTYYGPLVGRPYVENTLRLTTPFGALDTTHRYAVRQKPSSITQDAGSADHGVESNLLTATNAFRPTRRILARVSSGYDFRVFANQPVIPYRARFQPFVTEVYYTPRSTLNLLVRDEYLLTTGNRSFIASGQLGDEQSSYYSFGAGYNQGTVNAFSASPNRYYVANEFGWAPTTSTWRVTVALRADFAADNGLGSAHALHAFDKEVGVVKIWHDFFMRALVRFRAGGVREGFIRIDLRLPQEPAKTLPHRDWESEWFPERRQGMLDRP